MKRIRLEIIKGAESARDADGWEHYRYEVKLRFDGRSLTCKTWKQGGITDDPEPHAVIGSMLQDTAGYENSSGYHDWCDEYGYDSDSISNRETYEQVKDQAERLERFLGRSLMVALMEDEDATYGSAERFDAAMRRAQNV